MSRTEVYPSVLLGKRMTPAQLIVLKTELTTDPGALGYATPLAQGSDGKLADVLNLRRSITLRRVDVSATEIMQAIDYSDLNSPAAPATPTASELRLERLAICFLTSLSAMGAVRLQNDDNTFTPIGANLNAIVKTGTGTRTRIVALATRTQCSRAEQLFGIGFIVSADDVSASRLV